MQLTFGQVEDVIRTLHAPGERKRATLRGRIQNLQRGGFPPSTAVGKGPKASYGINETFMLVIAMELTAARMSPLYATRLVCANWPALRTIVDTGIAIATARADGTTEPGPLHAVVALDGLANLRRNDADESDVIESVHVVPPRKAAEWLAGMGDKPGGRLLVLDLTSRVVEAVDRIRSAAWPAR